MAGSARPVRRDHRDSVVTGLNEPTDTTVRLGNSAALLFRRQGYAATGVNQILESADVKAGSLYHHFPSGKQELVAAVVDAVSGDIERRLHGFLDSDFAIADIVDACIDLMSAGLTSDQRDGCPIEPIATESVNASPQVRDASARAFSGWCWPSRTGCVPTVGRTRTRTRQRSR